MTLPTHSTANAEHPFAPYIRILGKGKTGTRSLTREEAFDAFSLILREAVEPIQLGAFLMLLRVKEETPEELAGFASACRAHMLQPPQPLQADLDWSSYAGKRAQHPWYLLSCLCLADAGYRVFMHGSAGHTQGRLYSQHALEALGLPVATGWSDVAAQLESTGFSYLSLEHFCPVLHRMMQLRPLLGLRSPVNTLARLLNPLDARASIQSVFHPAYAQLHQSAGKLLGHTHSAVFKGDSGEVEAKPHADTAIAWLLQNEPAASTLPRTLTQRPERVVPDTQALVALWRDEQADPYGVQAVLGTTEVALRLLEPALSPAEAPARARQVWESRNKTRL